MLKSREATGELVIARGDATEVFYAAEKPFDQIAILVPMTINAALIGSIGPRRNDGRCANALNALQKCIGIIGFAGPGR